MYDITIYDKEMVLHGFNENKIIPSLCIQVLFHYCKAFSASKYLCTYFYCV